MTAITTREPIHNVDAEAAVISALLNNGRRIDRIPDLGPGHFYVTKHQRIFEAIRAVADGGEKSIVQRVAVWLGERDWLIPIGNYSELSRLRCLVHPGDDVAETAAVLRDLDRKRRLVDTLVEQHARIYADLTLTPSQIAATTMDAVSKLVVDERTTMRNRADVATELQIKLKEQWAGKRDPWGLSIHRDFPRLNSRLGGFKIGGVYVIAGETSAGKSVKGQQFLNGVAGSTYDGERCGVADFTLEMTTEEVTQRDVCTLAGVSDREVRTGCEEICDAEGTPMSGNRLHPDVMARIDEAFKNLRGDGSFEIDTKTHSITSTLRAAVRRAKTRLAARGYRLRMISFDHAGLAKHEGRAQQTQQIEDDCAEFKRICVEEEVAGLFLCQLNREGSKADRPPMVTDLKGSSAIEQIATGVLLIDRLDQRETDPDVKARILGKTNLIVAKLRDGARGTVPMHLVAPHFYFTEQVPDYGADAR